MAVSSSVKVSRSWYRLRVSPSSDRLVIVDMLLERGESQGCRQIEFGVSQILSPNAEHRHPLLIDKAGLETVPFKLERVSQSKEVIRQTHMSKGVLGYHVYRFKVVHFL
jgi:hypothetical protein